MNHVLQLQQTGKLDEAAAICTRILATSPKNGDALHVLGVILSQLKHHEEAISKLTAANAVSPKNHVFLTNLGAAHAANDDFEAAVACFRDAISIKPSVAESHYNLANALKDLHRPLEAIIAYRKALQLKSNYPGAWNNLGAMYVQLGKLTDAGSAIKRALALNPQYAAAHNNLANVQLFQGQIDASIQSCVQALTIRPDYVDAFRSLGKALIASRRFAEAIAAYHRAIEVGGDAMTGYVELARAQLSCAYYDGVVESLRHILELDHEHCNALKLMAIVQMERGYFADAARFFERAIDIAPDLAFRVRHALSLPPILGSADEVSQLRIRLSSRLDILMNDAGVVEDPFGAQIGTNFFLAYHGLNDRDIQIRIAGLYAKLCPSLRFVAPHCAHSKTQAGKVRIGFLSKYVYKHSVATSFSLVVERLSELTNFEVFLISTTDHQNNDVKAIYPNFKGAFATIPEHLFGAQTGVATLGLDVLIYLDLGMDPLSFLLAFARLAPIQCVMGGHPVTTGIPNVDYFLSADLAEPESADAHYSEKLIRLKTGGFSLSKPLIPTQTKSREQLGLPAFGKLYLCPMLLQKIHPDFDPAIARILALDTTGHVVLFESGSHPRWGELLRERFVRSMHPDVRERVIFHAWVDNHEDFILMNQVSDVVLDPFHFGIGTTGAFTFAVGTPLVTLPGEFMRGRVGLMFCKLLDTMECVAANAEDYAQKAVAIAHDPNLRALLKEKILRNQAAIFDNQEAAAAEIVQTIQQLTAH